MRLFLSALLRAVCALIIGGLLVSSPQTMTGFIVQVIGGMFILLGLTQAVGYWFPRGENNMLRPIFPFVGLGSVLLGVVLVLMPNVFVAFLMYVLGFILALVGFNQILTLIAQRHVAPLRWWVFLCPLALLCLGLFIVFKPLESASLPFVILGVGCIVYGLVDLFYALRLAHYQRQKEKEYVEFEEVPAEPQEEHVDA